MKRYRDRVMAAAALIVVLAAGAATVPAHAQSGSEPPRVGVLLFMAMTSGAQNDFREGFREHGYVEGQNLVVDWRSADGSTERADALAQELVRAKVSVIIAEFTPSVRAAKNATQTIPIIMASAGNPVATGLVASLARPGGNVTGLTNVAAELSGKRLDLLREIMPGLGRVGMLINGADPIDKAFVEETRAAAGKARVQLYVKTVPRAEELEGALAAMTKDRVGAVLVMANLPVSADKIAQAAVRHRLPTISLVNQFAEAGGLMSYGASISDMRRRTAGYVARIFKGAKPADLPVEQPTKFDLVVNAGTARALGLTIPPSVLLRADRVID